MNSANPSVVPQLKAGTSARVLSAEERTAAMGPNQPPTKKRRDAPWAYRAPQDNTTCAYACWMWGTRPETLLEILTLGTSHEVHGSKIQRVLCAEPDTRDWMEHHVLRAFWRIKNVQKLKVPDHLAHTELDRLVGVYSKLQVWKYFADPDEALRRVLMMDGDMILNGNIDEVFSVQPVAGVMRGEADTCLFEPRPASSFFQDGKTSSFTHEGKKMKGGINGGLVLLEPNLEIWKAMREALKTFKTPTDMAEQDFISFFFGRKGELNAIHKKNNFQTHQMYFVQGEVPPHGQKTPSTYWWLLNHPDEIKVYHYSSSKKPTNMLLQMPTEDTSWVQIHEIVSDFVIEFEKQDAVFKRISNEIWYNEDIWRAVREASRTSLVAWLEMWIKTWIILCEKSHYMLFMYGTTATDTPKGYCCNACGRNFDKSDTSIGTNMRDHLFFNCPAMRERVWVSMNQHEFNVDLRKLFFVPTGSNVMKKIRYISALIEPIVSELPKPLASDQTLCLMTWQPVVITDHPLYEALGPLAEVDPCHDALKGQTAADPATEDSEAKEERWGDTITARVVDRRYDKAIKSIRKRVNQDYWSWTEPEQEAWASSLDTASKAVLWHIKHKDRLTSSQDVAEKKEEAAAGQPNAKSMAKAPTMLVPQRAKVQKVAAQSASASRSGQPMTARPKAPTVLTAKASSASTATAKARPARLQKMVDLTADEDKPPWKK